MNDFIKNIFSFIPDHIDNTLRYLLIFLITIQFTSFLLFIVLSTRTYLILRKERQNVTNENQEENNNDDKDKDNLNREKIE